MCHETKDRKFAVVTGSSQGIGRAIAHHFLAIGYQVVLNGRNSEKLARTAQSLARFGPVLPIVADISDYRQASILISEALEKLGRIDVLVNNGGIKFQAPFEHTLPHTFRQIIETNLLGAIYTTREAVASLTATKGSVIFIGSLAGLYGLPYASIYSASKMGLAAIAQSLRIELGEHGVHVGVLYVGFTENDEGATILDGSGAAKRIPDRGVPRQPQDTVARAVVKMVHRRKAKKVLSRLGSILDRTSRHFPTITHFAIRSQVGEFRDGHRK